MRAEGEVIKISPQSFYGLADPTYINVRASSFTVVRSLNVEIQTKFHVRVIFVLNRTLGLVESLVSGEKWKDGPHICHSDSYVNILREKLNFGFHKMGVNQLNWAHFSPYLHIQ